MTSLREGTVLPDRDARDRLLALSVVVDLTRRTTTDAGAREWLRVPNADLRGESPLGLVEAGEDERVVNLLLAIAEGVTG